MQTPAIRFGRVYQIASRACDAAQRAEALVSQKRSQGVQAAVDARGIAVIAEDHPSMYATVYTNEGDNALDCYERGMAAQKNALEVIEREFPYLSQDEETRTRAEAAMSLEELLDHTHTNMRRIFSLMNGGEDGIQAWSELQDHGQNAERLYFNRQGEPVDASDYRAGRGR